MDDIAVVRKVMEAILAQDLEPALGLVAEDVAFTLASPDKRVQESGRPALADYFRALGGIVTFWKVRFLAEGGEVLVLGNERFRMNGGLEVESEFALVFGVRDGLVARLMVVEDTSSWPGRRLARETLLLAV